VQKSFILEKKSCVSSEHFKFTEDAVKHKAALVEHITCAANFVHSSQYIQLCLMGTNMSQTWIYCLESQQVIIVPDTLQHGY